ncbi:sensor histidine kinase [Olleya marilimosa]|uniref:histidine kinase n=1 Tax=Olleya marilimosa TaxID=272164 RepID=A0ABR8M1H2_9FLAO|nr:HAMP domain-containing sensor histidine kinase [Olleya marilimosa]MBD3864087.1 PAS domain S-box protein [Olleya marilimosa]MBD3891571.1 PAS domain S-box protein [Olleya marilimosa]
MKELYNQLFQNHVTKNNVSYTYMDSIQRDIAIGSWEVNLQNNEVTWSAMTKTIHEVEQDYNPSLEEGINFFLEGYDRELMSILFNRAVNKQEPYDNEVQLKTAKNNIKWVRIVAYPVIKNDATQKVIGVIQDITEKNKTLLDLKLKEELIRTTFDNAPNAMALVSLDGQILTSNKSFSDYLGYTKEELIGFPINTLSHSEDIDVIPQNIKDLIAGKSNKFQCEKRYIRKDKSIIHCLLSVSILRDENFKPVHFISHIIDITKRTIANKKVETLLKTTKLQNERLLNFAHIVSHNLRSHSGNIQMLLDLMYSETPEATNNEYVPLILEAVHQLSETIDNLNQVSTINDNKEQDLQRCNLLDFTNKAISNFSAEIKETKAIININIEQDIYVLAIPAYLDSLLFNFISNALKYKQDHIPPEITLSAEQSNKFIKIEIEDNGLGINLDLHKDKIFGLYKTFHNHKEAKGLGLYITKNQIEAMQGKVKVKSKINKGTIFSIYLKYETN